MIYIYMYIYPTLCVCVHVQLLLHIQLRLMNAVSGVMIKILRMQMKHSLPSSLPLEDIGAHIQG